MPSFVQLSTKILMEIVTQATPWSIKHFKFGKVFLENFERHLSIATANEKDVLVENEKERKQSKIRGILLPAVKYWTNWLIPVTGWIRRSIGI